MSECHCSNWIILKFGGTSVTSRACWETIAGVARQRLAEGLRPVIVCSALAGVSDQLECLIAEALVGRQEPVLAQLIERHLSFARELGVEESIVQEPLDALGRIAQGMALTREVSPKLKAQVMSQGELLSTRLGAAFLKQQGLASDWRDARELIGASEMVGSEQRRYLAASCATDTDEGLAAALEGSGEGVVVTQGFIAANAQGETVLLGRGGSDISAAVFATKLGATRCEIWTDVPGLFTADPRRIPQARLLLHLGYDEAQEIASFGAKVLHPKTIAPLKRHDIPIVIRWMERPDFSGTVISADATASEAQVKAISAKRGITVVSMETVEMWHQVGFLAQVFDCFRQHGLSVDLVSSSETNITVTIDNLANALDPESVRALVADLKRFCQPRVVDNCAMVSLVGRHIRSILHEVGPALAVFAEQRIYMLSQAANDLNLTCVVDEDQATPLAAELHAKLFGGRGEDGLLGPSWQELFEPCPKPAAPMRQAWWRHRADELIALAHQESPRYVYDAADISAAIERLQGLRSIDRIFYSVKANNCPDVLELIEQKGIGFECVSAAEIDLIIECFPGIDVRRMLFTPNFVGRAEYERAFAIGTWVTLDNLYPLEAWPDLFRGRDIFVRLDPGKGRGHHEYVHTAGTKSKFGIPPMQFDALEEAVRRSGAHVVGLHAHVGSNIHEPETWSEVALFLAHAAERFPDVSVLDMGGGLGVIEQSGQSALDLAKVDEALAAVRRVYPRFAFWVEPGRYIVAESGVLLARVTQTKHKGEQFYVGVDAGMNALIRPALYGAHHEIVNLSRLNETPNCVATVVGPICESGDILGYERTMPTPQEGDVLLVAATGAYGRVMSSTYNRRALVSEYLLT